ncbi:permease prefix domain 1-containing protein [Rhizohabitans arisaemae]|uniref:permease prefix domain 1-containing protein n=1 Tax=Rhizohabitans arisaemae TaxID=2720610 RepID=UPI0024B10798|nr:permease prefix domain 1-containing protein [Rhizohabitans arisaemae]
MTSPKTLTDRYVDAVLHRVPTHQRPDIERELRASIGDAVDDRISAGDDPADAEAAVLTELGDPVRLAAGYADRPLQLIGPAFYLDYTRLLIALLTVIVPAVAAAVGLTRGLSGDDALTVAGETLGAVVTTVVHIAFWTTLVFAVIERIPALRRARRRPWTPDSLPEPPSRRARYGELITLSVVLVLCTTFIVLSPVVSPETDANGKPIPIITPWWWESGVVYLFIVLVVAGLGFVFAKYYVRWSVPLAVAGSLVDMAAPILMLWLAANDRVLNPAFVQAIGWSPEAAGRVNTVLIVLAVVSIINTVLQGLIRARRG